MGRLFANFEPYDVQETRREAREEEIENGIRRLVHVSKKHGCTREEAKEDLMEQYLLDGDVAFEKVELYW